MCQCEKQVHIQNDLTGGTHTNVWLKFVCTVDSRWKIASHLILNLVL